MQTFIYIATTQGPVRVQAITEEDPDIKSVVCLDGMAEPLGISERYHDFVKKGTGLIHREFGHGSYRVDVDKPIDQGNSWQLGVYCAHVLHRLGCLYNASPQQGDRVLFVSGAVKSNGDIAPVDKIPEKCQVAAIQIKRWSELGCKVSCIFPGVQEETLENVEIQAPIWRISHVSEVSDLLDGTDSHANHASELMQESTQKSIQNAVPDAVPATSKTRFYEGCWWRKRMWPVLSLVMVLILVSMLEWPKVQSGLSHKDENHLLLTPGLNLVVQISEGKEQCRHTYRELVPLIKDSQFRPVFFQRLCSITYLAGSEKKALSAVLAFSLDRLDVIQLTESGAGWRVPIPLQQDHDRSYVVIALYESGVANFTKELNKQLLRWSLAEMKVTFVEVKRWIDQQHQGAEVYKHTLKV